MKNFSQLFLKLDSTNKTLVKLAALREYFSIASPADAAWAVHFLIGRKIKRLILSRNLRTWAAEEAGISDWLFQESYEVVGDLAETIALLLPAPIGHTDYPLHELIDNVIFGMQKQPEETQRELLIETWRQMDRPQRFILNKLLTGEFRVGVSQGLVTRAIAEVAGLDSAVIAHRLMGDWSPTAEFYLQLVSPETSEVALSRPYPFFLAHPFEDELSALGEPADWLAEWKWDGIRAQCIRRQGETFIWSRGEELVTERFPELGPITESLPDGTVLDGEIVGFKDGQVLPFSDLQKRIGRKSLGKKILADVPVAYIVFDLLEWRSEDIREKPFVERRRLLKDLIEQRLPGELPPERQTAFRDRVRVSPSIETTVWNDFDAAREQSREHRAEGLMIKRRDSAYGVGRVRGAWWKWKVTPFTIDAVLLYAQRGHGKRASLYTDYTFGVWSDGELVPFAKAYSGLTDAEIGQVDRFVRRNTIDKFGPVRHVKPELVMELAFENIQRSSRHKSGVAVRFPRIVRWRQDKPMAEADNLATILELLEAMGS